MAVAASPRLLDWYTWPVYRLPILDALSTTASPEVPLLTLNTADFVFELMPSGDLGQATSLALLSAVDIMDRWRAVKPLINFSF